MNTEPENQKGDILLSMRGLRIEGQADEQWQELSLIHI